MYTPIVLSNDATVSGYEHLVVTLVSRTLQYLVIPLLSIAILSVGRANPSSANFDWTIKVQQTERYNL